ncbi:MAG: hypothetical protein ACXV3S_09700, partial [Kineosporiaceae bacterium]
NPTGQTLPAGATASRRCRQAVARTPAVLVGAFALCLLTVLPASAHDNLPDAAYYTSKVTSVSPATTGLELQLTRAGESITLTNHTGSTVEVLGYTGEEYLRFTSAGVEQNKNSLSAFLNGSLIIQGLPQQLGPTSPNQPPTWQHVSDTPTYTWHDHRIHWMALQRPPAVAADPARPHHVFDWALQLEVANHPVTVKGTLDWTGIPGVSGAAKAAIFLVALVSGLALVLLMIRLRLQRNDDADASHDAPAHGAPPSVEPHAAPHEAVSDTDYLDEWENIAGRRE